jgi:hypothetical protein
MREDRVELLRRLEEARESKVLLYVTGDRPGLETQIHEEVFDYFSDHLDNIGVTKKISLVLYTRGGNTLAAWSIINLIRQFCDELEIIVPSKCHSSGTIMCLGANKIVMTKQATLGPIDPSLNTPLNPAIPNAGPTARYPVSVEAVQGYIEFIQSAGIRNETETANILLALSEKVHPLVLGQMYRSRSQIQMLARKLLKSQVPDPENVDRIINFLCSDSGSHDYTINRREAKNELGLIIEKPGDELYSLIKSIYVDFKQELQLGKSFSLHDTLGVEDAKEYECCRGLVETPSLGSHRFITSGILRKVQQLPPGAPRPQQMAQGFVIDNQIVFEGWRHESN